MRLEQEGLLEALPNGGYAVRTFSERDIADAIELRGTLEGLAARLAAERGVGAGGAARGARLPAAHRRRCCATRALDDAAFSRYVAHNAAASIALLSEMAGSALIAQQIERVINLPFASPNGLRDGAGQLARTRATCCVSRRTSTRRCSRRSMQREGSRAEALMREHGRIAQRNLREALHSRQTSARAGRAADPPPRPLNDRTRSHANTDIHWMPARIARAASDLSPTVREFEITPESGGVAGRGARRPPARAGAVGALDGRMQTRSYSVVGAPDGATPSASRSSALDDGRGGSRRDVAAGGRRPSCWSASRRTTSSSPFGARRIPAGGRRHRHHAAGRHGAALARSAARDGAHAATARAARTSWSTCRRAARRARRAPATFARRQPARRHRLRRRDRRAAAAAASCYTCGPVPMLEAVKRAWARAGRPPADLRFETFGSSGAAARRRPSGCACRATACALAVPAERTLLDVLEGAGVETLWDCRRGECGLCAMDVLAVARRASTTATCS